MNAARVGQFGRLLLVVSLAQCALWNGPPRTEAPPPPERATTGARAGRLATLTLPLTAGSVRFAVIGDTGRGNSGQIEVGRQMAAFHKEFPFDFVIMVGDNIYGADAPADMVAKFESPYKELLDAGVKFQASLGNHDNPNQRFYKLFNMGDERYYTFRPPTGGGVRLFALDTTYIDKAQTDWFEKELASSTSDWKIAFFHHPLYSSGRTHGSSLETRAILEPLFLKYQVSAAFSGHDHFYERVKPQKGGIVYWVSGAGGSLRKGDIAPTTMTAKGFDRDYHFMLVEIAGDELYFQAISRTGVTIDSGVVHRPGAPVKVPAASPVPEPVLVVPAPVPLATPVATPTPMPAAKPTPLG
jgi:hypothetical protein